MSRTHRDRSRNHAAALERTQRPFSTRSPSPQRTAKLKAAVRDAFLEHAALNPRDWHVEVDAVEPLGRPLTAVKAWLTLHHLHGLPDPIPGMDDTTLHLAALTPDDHTALANHLQHQLNTQNPVELRLQAIQINRHT